MVRDVALGRRIPLDCWPFYLHPCFLLDDRATAAGQRFALAGLGLVVHSHRPGLGPSSTDRTTGRYLAKWTRPRYLSHMGSGRRIRADYGAAAASSSAIGHRRQYIADRSDFPGYLPDLACPIPVG